MKFFVKWVVIFMVAYCTIPTSAQGKSNYGSNAKSIPVNEFKCTKTGFFRHPQSRHRFYECVQHPAYPNRLISYTYSCHPNQCFDETREMRCSSEACSRNGTEEFTCLRNHLQRDAQLICQNETISKLERLKPKMVEFTAFRGNAFDNLMLSLRDVNWDMRQNYGRMIENVGKNIYPLMVVTDGEPDYLGVGGVFKVYHKDGTLRRIIPVNAAFEMYKSLCHLVLGVFSIVSPYFRNPNSINWQPPLRNFQQNCRNVQFLIERGETGITASGRELALTILTKVITYIQNAITSQSVDMAVYQAFANDLAPYIEQGMARAARAHAKDTIPALQKLKREMGEEEWRELHVIIPTVWPVSLFNIRLQALEKVMSFDQIKSQVLIVEGARSEADAMTTMGRVYADRVVAQLVWGGLPETDFRDHVFSLSTRRDLLSSTVSRELNRVCQNLEEQAEKPRCPFAGRSGAPNSDSHDMPAKMSPTMLRS